MLLREPSCHHRSCFSTAWLSSSPSLQLLNLPLLFLAELLNTLFLQLHHLVLRLTVVHDLYFFNFPLWIRISLLLIFFSFCALHACRLLRCGSHLASEHHTGEQSSECCSDVGLNDTCHRCEHGVPKINSLCLLIRFTEAEVLLWNEGVCEKQEVQNAKVARRLLGKNLRLVQRIQPAAGSLHLHDDQARPEVPDSGHVLQRVQCRLPLSRLARDNCPLPLMSRIPRN